LKDSIEASNKHGYPRYQSFQPEYNLYARQGFEKEQEAICLENHIGVITYYSLASGFLTGKYRSEADLHKSARGEGIRKYLDERGYKILSALDEVATQYKSTPAAVSLAWLLARPSATAPIASATSITQLNDLVKATELQLSNETIGILDKASAWE